jgi:hypothetical protein
VGSSPGPRRPPDKPAPVALNLDTLEREGGPTDPFVFVHGGERILLSDPAEMDWQKLLNAMRDPVVFFQLVIPPDCRDAFFNAPMAGWKMNKLMQSYMAHYGMSSPGEANASPAL